MNAAMFWNLAPKVALAVGVVSITEAPGRQGARPVAFTGRVVERQTMVSRRKKRSASVFEK